MSTTTTYTGVRIVDMPDLGPVTDAVSLVAEHAGSGRVMAAALKAYTNSAPDLDALTARVTALEAAMTALTARVAEIEPVYIRVD